MCRGLLSDALGKVPLGPHPTLKRYLPSTVVSTDAPMIKYANRCVYHVMYIDGCVYGFCSCIHMFLSIQPCCLAFAKTPPRSARRRGLRPLASGRCLHVVVMYVYRFALALGSIEESRGAVVPGPPPGLEVLAVIFIMLHVFFMYSLYTHLGMYNALGLSICSYNIYFLYIYIYLYSYKWTSMRGQGLRPLLLLADSAVSGMSNGQLLHSVLLHNLLSFLHP
jgi:hypothetical protein